MEGGVFGEQAKWLANTTKLRTFFPNTGSHLSGMQTRIQVLRFGGTIHFNGGNIFVLLYV